MSRGVTSGAAWMIGARLAGKVIDLVSLMVLVRLLSPADFGLVAIGMTVVVITEAILELPTSQALVRLAVVEPAHYDTAFSLSLIRAAILMLVVVAAAWPFARLYDDPRLTPLLIVLSLAPASRGMVSPRMAHFAKQMNFARDFVVELSGKVVAMLAAAGFAWVSGSYWALAVSAVVSPMVAVLVSYCLAPYRPRLGLYRWPDFRAFLGWSTAAQVVVAITWQADRLILGKLASREVVGQFSAASDLAHLPMQAVVAPATRPILSHFVRAHEAGGDLRRVYLVASAGVAGLVIPLAATISTLSDNIVRLVFGPAWLASSPLLMWLALSTIPAALVAPFPALAMSLGNTQLIFRRNMFEAAVKIPSMIVAGLNFGIYGILAAKIAADLATTLLCMASVDAMVGLRVRDQILAHGSSFLGAVLLAGTGFYLAPALLAGLHLPIFGEISIKAALCALVYIIAVLSLWALRGRPPGLEATAMEWMRRRFRR